ncbi:MAG: type VII toxin-antitoxin system HepT family RNase toxin [Promethearchaeota archaeon]
MNSKNQRILIKIAELEENLAVFPRIVPQSEEIYFSSKKDQLALERLFQICIEEVIDISAILINKFKLGVPANEENILDLLKGKLENIEKLKEMKRFRNIIVHKYGEIDNHLVFHNAKENVNDFYKFIANVKKII